MAEFERAARRGGPLPAGRRPSSGRPRACSAGPAPDALPPALGNQAVQRLLASHAVQAKLTVSEPGDVWEREADSIARRVVSDDVAPAVAPPIQRMPAASPTAEPPEKREQLERTREKQDRRKKMAEVEAPAEPAPEEKKKEEDEPLQTRRASGSGPVEAPPESALDATRGAGAPLAASDRADFEARLGHDLGEVRVHTDERAGSLARALDAHAFTRGSDIYFAPGRFAPETDEGRALLAHELVHTIQQAPSAWREATPGASTVAPVAPALRAADGEAPAVARQATAEGPAVDGAGAVAATPEEGAADASGAPAEVMELMSSGDFTPSTAVAEYLRGQGNKGGTVRVKFGHLATGDLTVRQRGGQWETRGDGYQTLDLVHPALEPLQKVGVKPVLALRIKDNHIDGYASIATRKGVAPKIDALTEWMEAHATEMGWLGFDNVKIPKPENKLGAGVLTLQVPELTFRLGGFLQGHGHFGLQNELVTFDANVTVKVKGITEADLHVERDAEGQLFGHLSIPVTLAKFTGNAEVDYGNGTVDIEGKVRYTTEKLTGEVTLLVTDAATARNVAIERLGPEAVIAAAKESSAEPAKGKGPKPGERALAGYGVLDFALTQWLTGQAQVIVDNEGHITLIGKIAPPAEINLFEPPQREWITDVPPKIEVRAAYGLPVIGNVFAFASISLQALAKLGPAKIYKIEINGRYSTDPVILNEFSITGTLNVSAFAGLRLRGEGGVGLEILSHDIKVGVGVFALAGVRGYVEATPTIGYREVADPVEGKKGEAYLRGHMELAAQPFLGLGGDLFVDLDSPWWSPAPDKRWTWPLGELEYPLPGEFGIGADIEYLIGSPELPEVQFGKVDFNADKFMTDLMNDEVPPKKSTDEEKKGEWTDSSTTEAPPDPALVDSAGPAPKGEIAAGRLNPEEAAAVPSPEVAARWAHGLQAIGGIAEKSQRDAFTAEELQAALAPLRDEYGFTDLRAVPVGEDWGIEAAMNPKHKATEPPTVEKEPKPPVGPDDFQKGDFIQTPTSRGWRLGMITEVAADHLKYDYMHLRVSPGGGQAFYKAYGEFWRKFVPGTSFKSGTAWEEIRDLPEDQAWDDRNDARQVLNWRHHEEFTNPANKEWHHIHEFSADGPNSVANLVLTTRQLNADLNTWYGRPYTGTGASSVRDFLKDQPASEHTKWGLRALSLVGNVKPDRRDDGRGPYQITV